MKKKLLLTLMAMSCHYASAQQPIQQLFSVLRPLCMEMVQKDKIRDITKLSSLPVDAEKVCDCANERLAQDPVVQRAVNLSNDERRALSKSAQMLMYMSSKYYSMSMACYSNALSITADHIDIGPWPQ